MTGIIRIQEVIIKVPCKGDPWNLGRALLGTVRKLPLYDVNHPFRKRGGKLFWKASYFRSMGFHRPIEAPGASTDPGSAITVIIGELWKQGYVSRVVAEDDLDDIDYIYIVNLSPDNFPSITFFEKEIEGDEETGFKISFKERDLLEAIRKSKGEEIKFFPIVAEEDFPCDNCGKSFFSDELKTGADGRQYCEECFNKLFAECSRCGEPLWKGYPEEYDFYRVGHDGNIYCHRCYRELFTPMECSGCGKTFYSGDLQEWFGEFLCPSCIAQKMSKNDQNLAIHS